MGPLPKPFLTLLCYDAAIWAALLTVIGITVGGDPAWLAAIGIGGVGLTSTAAWLATRPHDAPSSEPAGEETNTAEPETSEAPGGLTEAELSVLVSLISGLKASGITIVWIEHILHALLKVIDRLICMSAGQVIAEGSPREVMADRAVVGAYLGGVQ